MHTILHIVHQGEKIAVEALVPYYFLSVEANYVYHPREIEFNSLGLPTLNEPYRRRQKRNAPHPWGGVKVEKTK